MGVTALAVLGVAAPVMAQKEAAGADQIGEVVVTATRVNRSGFNAPTPTTMLNTDDILRRAPNNVSEVLNELPTFRATTSPNTSSLGVTGSGQTFLDLRGIGSQRTLTLLNGRRHVPSALTGQVDVNLIPSTLIENVEVVTGGASASWGSDAVAGVVNIILKKRLQGVEASAQYGITDRSDGQNYTFGVAAGTGFLEDRGQITIGGEYSNDTGIDYKGRLDRDDWIKGRGSVSNTAWATNGMPATIYAEDIQYANHTPGGMITGPLPAVANAGLRGVTFNADGTQGQFQFGQVFGANMIGGSQPGNNFLYLKQYRAPVLRKNVLGRLDYAINDGLNFNVELSEARSTSDFLTLPILDLGSTAATVPAGTPAGVLIARIENPFLPAAVRTRMQAAGLTAVFIGRDGYDLNGYAEDLERVVINTETQRFVAGLDGELGFADWRWDAYYQYGHNELSEVRSGANRIMPKYREATDVVTNPANGQPICRSTLTNPTNGCVPFNIFGVGTSSAAARAYVTGVATLDNVQIQHVAALNLRGDLFMLPAGPISAAFGAEWRKETTDQVVDPLSAVRGFEFTNPANLAGSISVKELYGELVSPLLKDSPVARELDLQLAGRYTDYSLSGAVASWKAGLTWNLNGDWRLRGAVSRDIRAANVSELFASAALGGTFLPVDRVLNVPGTGGTVSLFAEGNPNLEPERATTYTGGVVLQPEGLQGFKVSADYYKIEIKGQITRVDGQTIIDRCAQGLTAYCGLINRNADPANRFITSVRSPFLNLNLFETSGVDFEMVYARPMPEIIPVGGDFVFRALATYTDKFATTDALGTIDRSGQLGGTGVPHWLGNATITYNVANFSASLQGRFIQGGNIDNLAKPGTSTSANLYTVPAETLWNLSASYDIVPRSTGRQIQVFGIVSNLFDSNPPFPFVPTSLISSPYYDGFGRAFRAGVRMKL
ncbi:MAG: TonB-dependent receptor [Pseudomonadota bacterium]